MSKARRETKWRRCSMRWNGQANSPVQRRTDGLGPEASASRAIGVFSGHGQSVREVDRPRRLRAAPPAPRRRSAGSRRRPAAMTPCHRSRTSLRAISSALCRVALRPRRRPPSPAAAAPPGSARRCGPPGCRWPPGRCGPAGPGTSRAMAQRGEAGDEAQALLPVQAVDLVDHAVDVVAAAWAAPPPTRRRRPAGPGRPDAPGRRAVVTKPHSWSFRALPIGRPRTAR